MTKAKVKVVKVKRMKEKVVKGVDHKNAEIKAVKAKMVDEVVALTDKN